MTSRLLLFALLAALPMSVTAQDIAVRGEIVHTMAGAPIFDGVVIVRDGKIAAVGPAGATPIPQGMEVRSASVVTPGLVDAHTTVGLAGIYNVDAGNDERDESEALQPELRAIDSYNPREPLVEWLRSFGITTVHTGHAPGAVITGQTMVAKTWGNNVEAATLRPAAMLNVTLGDGATASGKEKPGTRAVAMAILRQALVDARTYRDGMAAEDASDRPDRDLRKEALARCLDGELSLLVTVHRHHDILGALRLAREFEVPLVLDGAAEAYMVLDEIKAAGVPVIAHPAMMRTDPPPSVTANATMELAALLKKAGIPFAQQSGYEGYVPRVRVLLLEAAIAGRYGLDFAANLSSITLDAARIIGVDDRVGSLEVGKDGDIALYDGDPFEYTTHCVGAIIEGVVVSEETR